MERVTRQEWRPDSEVHTENGHQAGEHDRHADSRRTAHVREALLESLERGAVLAATPWFADGAHRGQTDNDRQVRNRIKDEADWGTKGSQQQPGQRRSRDARGV